MLADLIARLEALDKAATPGPWEWMIHDHSCASLGVGDSPGMGTPLVLSVSPCEGCLESIGPYPKWKWGRCKTPSEPNAQLIAALRNELPRLLRLLRAGEKAKGSLERCDEYMDQRADADLAPGGEAMQPNREMVLMQEIRAALREWDEAARG